MSGPKKKRKNKEILLLWLSFYFHFMEYLSPSPHLQSVCVSRSDLSFLFLYPFNQSVYLVETFIPFTFELITDRYVLTAILFLDFCGSFSPFLLFSVIWWLSLVLYLDSIFFFVCILQTLLWLLWDFCIVVISICDKLLISNFKWICPLLPSQLLFLIPCFTSKCFVYPLTAYCRYRWFYYFFLLTSLLALCVGDFLPLLYVHLYCWAFPPMSFLFLIVAVSFSPREVLITFLEKLFSRAEFF